MLFPERVGGQLVNRLSTGLLRTVSDPGSTVPPMRSAAIDLRAVALRLADRRQGRTEANVQSDLHLFLDAAPLDLDDGDLLDVILEAPAGEQRRIDVEAGFAVFEVKRDLRKGKVKAEAIEQLAGYVRSRTEELGQRYVGVLTDGADWYLYHLVDGELQEVSSLQLDPASPDAERLCVWLEAVLATRERIEPTPKEIAQRLGAASPAHALDISELRQIYAENRSVPTVSLKRGLWAKLLTTAQGTAFTDDDELFVEHTLLVVSAELIAHGVIGFDPTDPTIPVASLLGGSLFSRANIGGVVESDFFDWLIEVEGGDQFVRGLARRLMRFAWADVEHDVMKVLYESVIGTSERHRLGEYYTPDWLADEIVQASIDDPLEQRVLDPACGSGTFLFHAVRQSLSAADDAGLDNPSAIRSVTDRVMGVDVHPVAVTFARVTYLLALGMERLQAVDRPPFSVPVYLGDSLQWGQETSLLTVGGLRVPTDDGLEMFSRELRFPERLLNDAGTFDRLVSELADRAADRLPGSPVPDLTAILRRYAVHPDDAPEVTASFKTMCDLHDEGRNHIWGYYVRNLARPLWLAQQSNKVDVLIGNPPWLSYRFMTEAMKQQFRSMSESRNLWHGATVATHQDLSGLFFARSVELYLREGGKVAMVLPLAALSRNQFAGFRGGRYLGDAVAVTFEEPWDLHKVKPSFFPVPACVCFGEYTPLHAVALPAERTEWSGKLVGRNMTRGDARPQLTLMQVGEQPPEGEGSPYAPRFAQGATVVPRMLFIVEDAPAGPLGAGAGRREVRSLRSNNEKRPWKNLPGLAGSVETQFIHPLYVGDTVLPFRLRQPQQAVIAWDGKKLLDGMSDRIDLYPGCADWVRRAESVWVGNRSSDRLSLREQVDYRRKLSAQFPVAQHRVVYSASGMYLAAAAVSDRTAVIEHALYWGATSGPEESQYIVAVLNSAKLTELVRPLQGRGEHNPRHYDKYVWQVPVPLYDPSDSLHEEIVGLAAEAEAVAQSVDLPEGKRFETLRRQVREALVDHGVAARLDDAVARLLDPN